MDKNSQGMSNSDCFISFSKDPKKVSQEILKGAHKHIAKIIKDGESGPTVQSLIPIFSVFAQKEIKRYVFTRMRKPILLELVLCIIQELVLNGPERAKTLHLEVVKSKSGGKTVCIADPFVENDNGYDEDFLGEVDEAFFRLTDTAGKSPEVKFASGQGHAAPYSPFGRDGSFIHPRPAVARSLHSSMEVCHEKTLFIIVATYVDKKS